jgi:arylsulfatase A-like enzyme
LGLSLLLPGGFLQEHELPVGARLFVLMHAAAVLILSVWITAKAAHLSAQFNHVAPAIRRWAHACFRAAVFVLFFLYVLSWATFWQIGKFLNFDAVRFWVMQPLQVFHWVDVDIGLAVIAATLALAFMLFHWLPRRFASWNPSAQDKLARAIKITFALCFFSTFIGEIYGGREEQPYLRWTMLYQSARDDRSTPLAHFIGRLRAAAAQGRDERETIDATRLIRRDIIPTEQYVAAIDPTKFKPWNVIVIIVESLRADQLRIHGSGRAVMPAVDSLAKESRVFVNAYSQSSQTSYAVLAPLSAHYPLRSPSQYAYPENPSYPRVLIHDVLKNLGYRTAVFSSSNENWEGMIHYLQTKNLDRLFHASVFKGPTYLSPGDTFFGNWVMATRHAGSVDDRFTVDEAIQWIEQSPDKPFFMYINLQNSHVPYRVPEGFKRRFGPEKTDFTVRFGYFPRDKVEEVKDLYADSLAYVDAQIGRLLDHLRQSRSLEKTVVVITGDHGQGFYEHGFAAHGGPVFDEVMKIPLIVRAPGLSPSIDDRLAQHIDVPPSVLDLLGLPPHPSFQGKSLVGGNADPDKAVFMVAQTPLAYQYGIIQSQWKLVYDERARNYLLFDLRADPGETTNLTLQEGSTVKRLAGRLHAWHSAQISYYGDPTWHRREYPPILGD